jgi:hypothetical protein
VTLVFPRTARALYRKLVADPTTCSAPAGSTYLHKSWAARQPKAGGRNSVSHNCVKKERLLMNGIIYLVGLVVVILAVLSFFGLR